MGQVISSDTRAMDALGRKFKAAQAKTYRDLQRKMRSIGDNVLVPVAKQKASFSVKIPPTIRASYKNLKVVISAGNAETPIAVWFEKGKAGKNVWRHPVFPRKNEDRSKWHWVDERDPLRPYLGPMMNESGPEAIKQLTDAALSAIRASIEE